MRKTRSDKGVKRGPRDPFKINSQSSDAAIRRMLTKVNSVIDTYRIEATDRISNEEAAGVLSQAASRVQNILSFGPANESINLVNEHVPVTSSSIDYIRTVLKRQEDAEATQLAKDSTYKAGKKINELLKDLPTLAKKINEIQKQLENPEKYVNLSGEKLIAVPQGQGHRKAIWANRATALNELVARANRDWSDTKFSDVIDKLYEDQLNNGDIIDALSSGKWTGELMEEANLRAMGIETSSPFELD